MPRVDVVVPCYNYGRFLGDCVRSITSQSHRNLRVLIIDNASTDDSAAVAHALAREDDRIAVVARHENLGPHASYNEGIDWADGDYFVILDADDVMPSGAMARAIAIMEQHPDAAFLYGTEIAVAFAAGEAPELPEITKLPELERVTGSHFIGQVCAIGHNSIGATTVFRRTAKQKKAGHFRPALTYADDLEMCLRLAVRGDVLQTGAVQGVRRLHPGQATERYRARPENDMAEHLAAFESFFAHEGRSLPQSQQLIRRMRRSIVRNAVSYGSWLVREGRLASGYACIDFALRLSPTVGLSNIAYRVARRHLPIAATPHVFRAAVMRAG